MDQYPTDRQSDDVYHCPLCGGDNRCAVAAGESVDACWCISVHIDDALLDKLSAADRGTRCICRQCINNQGDTISEG